jgi:hypothetical protein
MPAAFLSGGFDMRAHASRATRATPRKNFVMKKSQRLRLAELKKRDAASLSADEKSELQRLELLAQAHPDASKDEDDTKPLSVSDFIGRMTAALKDKAALDAENKRLRARVSELEAGTSGTAANGTLLTAIAGFLGVKPADLASKNAEELTASLNARVDVRASELLGQLGFPADGIPTQTGGGSATDKRAELFAQYNKLSGAEQDAFWKKNIAPLFEDGGTGRN